MLKRVLLAALLTTAVRREHLDEVWPRRKALEAQWFWSDAPTRD